MSKVYADAVATPEPTDDLILGGSGDNVIVTAGATLKTNTIKDAGGNTIWTSDGSGNLSSLNSGFSSNITLISTHTISSAVASLDITTGIDSTYKLYIFKWFDWQGVGNGSALKFQANVAGASGFNETMQSTAFRSIGYESGSGNMFEYTDYDQANGTATQFLHGNCGNGADQCSVGYLYLFNPSSTTYTKQWFAVGQTHASYPGVNTHWTAGYFNVTGAITEITFAMNTLNIASGTMQMYGLG